MRQGRPDLRGSRNAGLLGSKQVREMVSVSLERMDGRLAARLTRWLLLAAPAGAFGLPLLAYLLTAAPSMNGPDGPDLAAAAYTLGIPHAPGYPFYTLLGWLFSHAIPFGEVAFRLNVLSALAGAGASAALFALCRRLGVHVWTALASALLLAFSYYFWADAIVSEVYALEVALLAATLLLLVTWDRSGDRRLLWAAAFVYGLALDGRVTLLLMAPALLAYVVWSRSRPGLRDAGVALGALALALSFYAYLPLRSATNPGYVWASTYADDGTAIPRDFSTASGFFWLVSGRMFRHLTFYYGPADAVHQLLRWGGWLGASFLGLGLPLGLIGAWRQLRQQPRDFVLAAGALLPFLAFYVNYGAVDKQFMFLPTYLIWAIWFALGVDWVWGKAHDAAGPDGLPDSARAAALLLPLVALVINAPLVSLRDDSVTQREALERLQQAPPQSVLIGDWTTMAPMQYLQQVEGMRPDVRLVQRWAVNDSDLRRLAAANVGRRPLFVRKVEPALGPEYVQAPDGDWYEVRAR